MEKTKRQNNSLQVPGAGLRPRPAGLLGEDLLPSPQLPTPNASKLCKAVWKDPTPTVSL